MSSLKWKDVTWVAFDTETTGKYPIESELCEVAAVKWQNGSIVDTYQQLIKPSRKMSQTVINIHHITNEMVESAPAVGEVIPSFYDFIKDSYLLAHHAPFDLGFLAIEFESCRLALPENPVFCTSLLSRKIFPAMPNHRLQTLVKHMSLSQGQAHRALDDSVACLNVALKCFRQLGEEETLQSLQEIQQDELYWSDFSMAALQNAEPTRALLEAVKSKEPVEIVYDGGSQKGQPRTIYPLGIVRRPTDEFIVARSEPGGQPKRFLLARVLSSRSLP